MKKLTWQEYFNGFYDWSFDTKKSYSYRLTEFGPADEVFEVLSEFAFYENEFATQFAEKAITAGVRFTPEDVLEMTLLIDKPVLSKMAELTSAKFTRNQLEEIYMLINDASFKKISDKAGIDIFSDNSSVSIDEESNLPEASNPEMHKPRKPGFFTTLLTVMAIESLFTHKKADKHNRRHHDG